MLIPFLLKLKLLLFLGSHDYATWRNSVPACLFMPIQAFFLLVNFYIIFLHITANDFSQAVGYAGMILSTVEFCLYKI